MSKNLMSLEMYQKMENGYVMKKLDYLHLLAKDYNEQAFNSIKNKKGAIDYINQQLNKVDLNGLTLSQLELILDVKKQLNRLVVNLDIDVYKEHDSFRLHKIIKDLITQFKWIFSQ